MLNNNINISNVSGSVHVTINQTVNQTETPKPARKETLVEVILLLIGIGFVRAIPVLIEAFVLPIKCLPTVAKITAKTAKELGSWYYRKELKPTILAVLEYRDFKRKQKQLR